MEELIDFEQVLADGGPPTDEERQEAARRISGLEGLPARRAGLRSWLESRRGSDGAGRRFGTALSLVATGLALLLFLTGVTSVLGLWERDRGGINVTLFTAVLLGVQWLVLLGAALAWLFRRRVGEGFSLVQGLTGRLAKRLAGERESRWWGAMIAHGGPERSALMWRLARVVQAAGVAFNLGAIAALAGLVLFRNVGFFWETTTEGAMREGLERAVRLLSSPWAWLDPSAAPGAGVIEATRWHHDKLHALPPGPAAWWKFLLWALAVWGAVPRLLLRWLCSWNERRALDSLDFQARHHRELWRHLFPAIREEISNRPPDGALVIDIGGAGFSRDALRPHLLRHLRVNPTGWETTGVLDDRREAAARDALRNAPAAIVLLAEGWDLKPRQMEALLARVAQVRENRRVIVLVGNATEGGGMRSPAPAELANWERFIDGLGGTELELAVWPGGES